MFMLTKKKTKPNVIQNTSSYSFEGNFVNSCNSMLFTLK